MADLRDRQRETTRDQIIDAVHALLADEHPATISMPQVAERAGTSLRTLYRYFPTKEALLDAAAESFRVPAAVVGGEITLATLRAYLQAQWCGFEDAVGAIRAQHLTPSGRALRDRRTPRARDAVGVALEREGLAADERLVDLIVAVTSSAMYLELVDRLGHDPEDAAALAAWTVGAIADRARREGGIA